VVGIAETNNGNAHPTCGPENLPTLPVEMCRLEFFIRGDTALDCSFYPVRFFFVDCSDNSIASSDGNILFLEDSVFQKGSGPDDNLSITDHLVPPPSYFGIPSSCVTYTPKGNIVRGIHLFGGGVRVICPDSSGDPTDINEDNSSLPMEFALHQNYPNPFNPSTTISFDLPHAAEVNVEIINVLGQVVWSRQERMSAGTQTLKWDGVRSDGSPVSSGVYYYRLRAADFVQTKKMILMK
jgi:hypothetical protein